MAFTFKEGKMASNQLDVLLANGVNTAAAFKDGSLVTLGELINDEVAGDNYPEYDTYAMTYADPAAEGKEVCIVDYAGISEGEINGNNYKMGIKLHNLEVPVGVATRVRRLRLHDKYWIGEGNISGIAHVTDPLYVGSNGLHVVGTAPTATFKAKVIAEREFTVGMKGDGKLYLVEVIAL